MSGLGGRFGRTSNRSSKKKKLYVCPWAATNELTCGKGVGPFFDNPCIQRGDHQGSHFPYQACSAQIGSISVT